MSDDLEEFVVDFVKERDYVSFPELSNHLQDAIPIKGDRAIECCKNGVMWCGMSDEFCGLMMRLLEKKKIYRHPACRMTYLIDGGGLDLPVPKNMPKDGMHVGYEQPVWIPVCFRVVPYDPEEEKDRRRWRKYKENEEEAELESIAEGIRRLVKRFDLHKVDVAFHRATWGDTKKKWAGNYGLKEAKGPVCAMRLLGKRCAEFNSNTGRFGSCACKPPASDHASLWTYKGKPAVYVFQPYGLSGDSMEELVDYCRQWKLTSDVSEYPAWHYPGHILFVQVYPKEGVYNDLRMGKIKTDKPEELADQS